MSLKFIVADRPTQLYTHHLAALCDYLTAKVMEPFLAARGASCDSRFNDFFIHGSESHPYEATGEIDFMVPGQYDCKVGELEQSIIKELYKAGISVGPLRRETHPDSQAVKVVHIPVVDNPTAQSGPPEVNISPNAGRLVLRDLLGIQPKNGAYDFTPADVLARLSSVKPEALEKCGAAPLWDPARSGQVRRTTTPKTTQLVGRCLQEIGAFAGWAERNRFQKLQAF